MKSVYAFHLQGDVNLSQSGAAYQNLYVSTREVDTLYIHDGEWSLSRKKFYFLIKGFTNYIKSPRHPKGRFYYTSKPSFKPFTSNWDIEKLSKREIKLNLTSDNNKYTMQLIPN